jgi:2'-5' RNA ligase
MILLFFTTQIIFLYIMAEELATVIQIGKRCYRSYPIRNFEPPMLQLKTNQLSLLDEDDGESEDEEIFSVDVNNFENFTQNKIIVAQEETITETIRWDPINGTFVIDFKLPPQVFYEICGVCSLDKTPIQRKIEYDTKTAIKGNPGNQIIEIRASSYYQVVQAHKCILDMYKITPRPTEYQVILDKITVVIKATAFVAGLITPKADEVKIDEDDYIQTEEPVLEDYPNLNIKFDSKWQGYITKLLNFPKDCADFLLADKGKNIKKLKIDMEGNVEYVLNKNEGCLDIVGYTTDQVKDGYAAFIRLIKLNKCMESFINSQKPVQAPSPKKEVHAERRFTHFLSINLENNLELSRVQKQVFDIGIPNLTNNMINPQNRFHITIAVLSLTSPDPVIKTIDSILEDLQNIASNTPIVLTFDRLGYFGKPNAANVVYIDLQHDNEFAKLNSISTKIHQALLKQSILTQSDLNKQKTDLRGNTLKKQYHMTLAKVGNSNKLMDLSKVLNPPLNFNIKVKAFSIELMDMRGKSYNSSYPIIHSFKLV